MTTPTNLLYVPPRDTCPINTLPNELLAHIFEIGTRHEEEVFREYGGYLPDEDEWQTESEYSEGDGTLSPTTANPSTAGREKGKGKEAEDSGNEDVPILDEDELPENQPQYYQVLVSHVCHKWREVSLSTPSLWTTIDFNKHPPFEQWATWLERSKGAPLDITIDSDKLFGPKESPTFPVNPENFDAIGFDDPLRALELVLPHVAQWRTFKFRAPVYDHMATALQIFSGLEGAPLLEYLTLFNTMRRQQREYFWPDWEKRDITGALFKNNVPALRGVALQGVYLHWEDNVSLLSRCTDLELSSHTFDVRCTYKEFAAILRGAHSLARLTLSNSGPKGRSMDEWLSEYTEEEVVEAISQDIGRKSALQISLPSLESLKLIHEAPSYVKALFSVLSMPNLKSLMLDFDEGPCDDVVSTLLQPSSNGTSLLYGLTDLKLVALPCDDSTIALALNELRHLRRLYISFEYNSTNWIPFLANEAGTTNPVELEVDLEDSQMSIAPPPGAWSRIAISLAQAWARSDTGRTGGPFCPQLESFTSVAIPGSVNRWLVERRIAMGAPLKELHMEEADDVEIDDEDWLREHLEKFDQFEQEEEEYSDTDDSDEFDEDDDGAEWTDEDDLMQDVDDFDDEDDFDQEDVM